MRKNYIIKEEIKYLDDNTICYMGYTIRRKGIIFNRFGKPVKVNKRTGNIRLNFNGNLQIVKAGRFIYELFNDVTLTGGEILRYRDGNITNFALDNLELVKRVVYFENHKWNYKIDEKTEKEIRKKYLEGSKNNSITIDDLTEEYKVCRTTIWRILKGSYSNPSAKRKERH